MSLLQAFTSGSRPSPVHPAASTATPPAIPGGANRLVTNASSNPNMPVSMAAPPTIAGSPRPNQATTQQRATLLGMFKKTDVASAPEGEQPQQSAGETLLKQMLTRAPSAHAAEPSGLQPGQPGQPGLALMSRLQQDVRDPGLTREAGTVPNLGLARSPAPNYAELGHAGNVAHNAPHRFTPIDQSPMATYASHERPISLTSPPATSSLPTPAILQGKNSMSHEQRHKLLSLFGKPQVSKHEGLVPDEEGKGKEVALPAASPIPSASGAAPLHLSESRRGSQTPISPADRSFLLNYLASATSKAQ